MLAVMMNTFIRHVGRSTEKEQAQARRQKMKWGGVFFCKKLTFPQRRVHYVQYQYFLFYILLIWGVQVALGTVQSWS